MFLSSLSDLMTQKVSFSLRLKLLIVSLVLMTTICQNQTQIFRFKQSFDTRMWLSKSLSVSSDSPQVILGSKNGTIKVFNYKTGQLNFQDDQHGMQIVGTVWIKDRNGLITASTDQKMNKSIAIIRDRNTFEETYRWEFPQTMKNMDYTETLWESYVGFNFITKIEEYELRLKNRTQVYYAFGGFRYIDISYSSNYSYLYATSKFENYDMSAVHHFPCGTNYLWYYWIQGYLSQIQANKYEYYNHPFFFKNTDDDGQSVWRAQEYQMVHYYQFPQNYQFKFFRFCPTDYILGVTSQNLIVLYTNDYEFNQITVIDKFSQQYVQIVQLQCKNGHIVVAGANNYLYVYQLFPFEEEEETNWLKIWFLIGIGLVICLLFALLIYKKVKNAQLVKKAKLNQELLDQGQSENPINQSILPNNINTSFQQ